MPYITQEERRELDPIIDQLIDALRKAPKDRVDGRLNYVIYRLLLNLYEPRYFEYNRAMGVLACVSQEFYRRIVAPYEDKKMRESGDIR